MGDMGRLLDIHPANRLAREEGIGLVIKRLCPCRFYRTDDRGILKHVLGEIWAEIEMFYKLPTGIEMLTGFRDADHRAAGDSSAPTAFFPRRDRHEF